MKPMSYVYIDHARWKIEMVPQSNFKEGEESPDNIGDFKLVGVTLSPSMVRLMFNEEGPEKTTYTKWIEMVPTEVAEYPV